MATEQKKEKILIIEGDGAFGEKIVKELNSFGYETVLIKNGTEGLQSIYDKLPHLIILDINLPDADGYDILSKKHSEPLLKKIPVFLLSTQGIPINMIKVPDNSVAEYILLFSDDISTITEKVNRHFGHNTSNGNNNEVVNKDAKKILWVEDDKLITSILSKKFSTSGFNVFHVKNGEEALEYVKGNIPDAIVLDLLLPGMNGFDILQRIKMDQRFKHTPVMILSNLSKPSDIEKAKILGAKKFVVKAAASLDQIVKEVKELMEISSQ